MNDKLSALYASACLYARDQQLDLQDKNVPAFVDCMAKKFAELIVMETMQVVANNLPPNTYLDVADAVIEHFKE